MMKDEVKVSVITVCWNCVNEIEKTIQSVISQTYSNVEYVVVDGASKDGTLDIINQYRDKISILISEPDKGIYNAMNKGVKVATGQWCIFMNAGDVFASDEVISYMFHEHSPKSTTKVYYGNTTFVNEQQEKCSRYAQPVYPTILRCQPYCHQSAFFNIESKFSPFFDEKYRIISDYSTSLRYFEEFGASSFEYIDVLVSEFAAFGGASTLESNNQKKSLEFLDVWKHHKICRKRYLIERFKYFIIYEQPVGFLTGMLEKYSSKRTEGYYRRTSM